MGTDLVSTVTASILIGNRHRYRGGIQPGWLLLVHEGSSVTLQLVRLHVFDGEELGDLDEQPGLRWTIPGDEDLVGALSLLLQLHLTRNADLIDAVREASALLTEQVVTLEPSFTPPSARPARSGTSAAWLSARSRTAASTPPTC